MSDSKISLGGIKAGRSAVILAEIASNIVHSCERTNDQIFYMPDINGGVLVFAHQYSPKQLKAVEILCAMRKLDTAWQTSGALQINLQKCSIIINKA